MSSRRIPISRNNTTSTSSPHINNNNTTTNNTTNNANQTTTTSTPFRSSLDLVFSYSRSAGFFGENLPQGPSFVDQQKYRPPNYTETSDEEEEEEQDDENDDQEEEEEEEDYSHEREEEGAILENWEEGTSSTANTTGVEQLPRNAKRKPLQPTRSILSSSPIQRPGGTPSSPPTLPPPPPSHATLQTETSPLLQPTKTRRLSTHSRRKRGRKFSTSSSSQFSHYGATCDDDDDDDDDLESGHKQRQRRGSTFSKEAWKAAIEQHRGESTWFQSLFNTVNVLVGVGLLAEPLAFCYGGWLLGTILLLFCALVTNYTAKMLASLMKLDPTQHTYADVLIKAFGQKSRRWIYALFVIELGTFSVAAIELFSDSLNSLFPKITSNWFKFMSYFILVPTTFLPLRLLSLTSLLGILSSIVLLSVIIADGTIKTSSPGSLWEPMETNFGPNWKKLPICFGLMMSGFSGHAVVPSLYRDMKNPQHFSSMINVAYVIAFTVSMVFAILGYLMFGNRVSSEITKDLSKTSGYPIALTKIAVWMVAINPLVKYAVANKPLVTTFEHLIGLHPTPPPPTQTRPQNRSGFTTSAISITSSSSADAAVASSSRRPLLRPSQSQSQSSSFLSSSISPQSQSQPNNKKHDDRRRRVTQLIRYWLLRPLLSIVFCFVAILIPDFDRVLSFLGSASAFVICCVGPIGAYLILSTTATAEEEEDRAEGGKGENGPPFNKRLSNHNRNNDCETSIGGDGRGGGDCGRCSGNTSLNTIVPPPTTTTATSAQTKPRPLSQTRQQQQGSNLISDNNSTLSVSATTTSETTNQVDVVVVEELIDEISSEIRPLPLTNAQKHWLNAAKESATKARRANRVKGGGGQEQVLIISKVERFVCWVLLITSILMAVTGTIWSFLPEF